MARLWLSLLLMEIIVGLSTLFWLIQNNPTAEPSLSFITNNKLHNFINVTQIWNIATWH